MLSGNLIVLSLLVNWFRWCLCCLELSLPYDEDSWLNLDRDTSSCPLMSQTCSVPLQVTEKRGTQSTFHWLNTVSRYLQCHGLLQNIAGCLLRSLGTNNTMYHPSAFPCFSSKLPIFLQARVRESKNEIKYEQGRWLKIQEYRTGKDLSFNSVICYCRHTGHIIYLISSQSSISSAVSILPTLFQTKGWSKPSAFWWQRTSFPRQSLSMASLYLFVLLPTFSLGEVTLLCKYVRGVNINSGDQSRLTTSS